MGSVTPDNVIKMMLDSEKHWGKKKYLICCCQSILHHKLYLFITIKNYDYYHYYIISDICINNKDCLNVKAQYLLIEIVIVNSLIVTYSTIIVL